jgi:Predicted phosphoesterases, related to the Icc protein
MILAISDTHGLLPDLDLSGIDRILIAGDICPTNNHTEQYQRRWLERNFAAWVEYLKLPVYLALGNHDFVDDFAAPSNLHYGTQGVIDDILLFSWVPQFFNWAWMAEEDELARRLNNVLAQGSPPIWVTHGPPYGVCDEVGGEHHGSKALLSAIELHEPDLVVCGHLHEGAASGMVGDTIIVNASILDDSYRKVRGPVVIER